MKDVVAVPLLSALLVIAALSRTLRGGGVGFWRRYMVLCAGLIGIFVAQFFAFGFVSWMASGWILFKLLVAGYVVSRVGTLLVPSMLSAMAFLAGCSFVGYFALLVVGPDAFPTLVPESFVGENLKSVVFHTVLVTDEWWRNAGPMWEPGAYQGLINLTLLLTPAAVLSSPHYRGRVALLVLALITTFSTAGYIIFFVICLYKILGVKKLGWVRWPLVIAIVVGATYVYSAADFLGEKIRQQVAEAAVDNAFSPDRFGALLFDLYYIQKSPWIGNGLHETTRFADHPELHGEALGHGNGLSNYVASLGFLGALLYLAGVWFGDTGWRVRDRLFVISIVLLLAFAQQFLTLPFFMALPFLHLSSAKTPFRLRSEIERRPRIST
jgi:hypothetical protein